MLDRQASVHSVESELSRRGPTLPSFDPGNRKRNLMVRPTLEETLQSLGLEPADLNAKSRAAIEALVSERNELRDALESTELALEQSQSLADHDPLTPVFNRRAFSRELSRSLSFCARYDASACLVYIDLDNFKALNDRHGHAAGDEALKQVGKILITLTRESDLIGRLGGDEFAVLLIHADQEAGNSKAEEFAAEIEGIRLKDGKTDACIGASCGVVLWRPEETPEQFIARADEAMYADKIAKGRSRDEA